MTDFVLHLGLLLIGVCIGLAVGMVIPGAIP